MGSEHLRLGGGELIIDISRSRHCFASFSKGIVLPNVFLSALFLSGSDHDDQRPISLCFCSEPGQIWSLKSRGLQKTSVLIRSRLTVNLENM